MSGITLPSQAISENVEVRKDVAYVEGRADDAATRRLLATVEDADAAAAVAAERAFLAALGGDCNTPIAAHARVADGRVLLRGLVTDVDGRRCLEDADGAPVADAARLGVALAARLLAAGADALVAGR